MELLRIKTKLGAYVSLTSVLLGGSIASSQSWPFAGGDLANSRYAGTTGPRVSQTSSLTQQWVFQTGGDVSATPTSDGTSIYFPDWGGYLYAINAGTGRTIWSHKIADYTGNSNSVSRTSPAISGNTLVIGDLGSGTVLAVQKSTGRLIWQNTVDLNSYAVITSSPVISGNLVFAGVASYEEGAAGNAGFIPRFRGSLVALDLNNGRLVWQTHTVPSGYTGGAIWGSTPAIDANSQTIFVGTGNNYTIPPAVSLCLIENGSNAVAARICLASNDFVDSVIALDMNSGAVKWADRLEVQGDTWNDSCIVPGLEVACPNPEGEDYDFGSGPNLFTVGRGHHAQQILGIGQKSGVYWALDPTTGAILWSTTVGPGGILGGIQWGSACDGTRVYVAISNYRHSWYQLTPSRVWHNGGSWAALDAGTGNILWQVKASGTDPLRPGVPAMAQGPMTVSNGVVYGGSMSGDMVALNASSGATLWTQHTAGSVGSGPLIMNGGLYWGSGYSHWGAGKTNNQLYYFAPGSSDEDR